MTATPPRRGLLRPRPLADPSLRLLCLPHAGSGAVQFVPWAAELPGVEVVAAQLPGREGRLGEPAFERMEPAVAALAETVAPLLDRPWAVFGHSMGALLAFELAREVERRGWRTPERLVLSGRRAPGGDPEAEPLHVLPDERFVAEVRRRYDGIPQVILDEPELLELFLPTLRADFALVETYRPRREPAVAAPFSVWAGEDDRQATREDLEGWRHLSRREVQFRFFPGGHFYVQTHRPQVLAALSDLLTPVASGSPSASFRVT